MESLLESLECPLRVSDSNFLRQLVIWLEDRKIRCLNEAQRDSLRRDPSKCSDAEWEQIFANYLGILGCPFPLHSNNNSNSILFCLNWLVGYAVSLEYEDCHEQQQQDGGGISSLIFDTNSTTTKPVDEESAYNGEPMRMDVDSSTGNNMSDKIDELGRLLHISRSSIHEDDITYLDRISRCTRLFVKENSLRALLTPLSPAHSLADFPLGFDTCDITVNNVSLVLRMLYLYDLRELQHDLNALLVMGQEYTANPRTNSSLGKVGR